MRRLNKLDEFTRHYSDAYRTGMVDTIQIVLDEIGPILEDPANAPTILVKIPTKEGDE